MSKRGHRDWFRAIKASAKCTCCPESDPCVLEFHHVNPSSKTFTISHMVNQGMAYNKILDELRKCVPLCSNCHKKVHAGRIMLERLGASHDQDVGVLKMQFTKVAGQVGVAKVEPKLISFDFTYGQQPKKFTKN